VDKKQDELKMTNADMLRHRKNSMWQSSSSTQWSLWAIQRKLRKPHNGPNIERRHIALYDASIYCRIQTISQIIFIDTTLFTADNRCTCTSDRVHTLESILKDRIFASSIVRWIPGTLCMALLTWKRS